MINSKKIELPDFSENTRKELEEKRKDAERELKKYSQKVESSSQLIEDFDAILGVPQRRQDNGEKPDSSALTPTKFVMKIFDKDPDRWISLHEFLSMGRSAEKSGEVKTKGAEIVRSIHGVLSRFRKQGKVLTQGKRNARMYKLKPK